MSCRPGLLSREQFSNSVLFRDVTCVAPRCDLLAVDAHHVLNRNLWLSADQVGGYFLSNGAGLCSDCHLMAEQTLIPCEVLYEGAGIERVLPRGWDESLVYDTWGNVVVDEWTRRKGPLWGDDGCQRALRSGGVLWRVTWLEA